MRSHRPSSACIGLLCLSLILTSCTPIQVTPTSTLTPSPSPTLEIQTPTFTSQTTAVEPLPEPRFEQADLALSFGDYDQALKLYNGTPPMNTDEYRAAALFGKGLTQYEQGDFFHARQTLDALGNAYPQSLPALRSNYLLGLMDQEQDLPESALADFQEYLKARPGILDADVYEQVGDLYTSQGKLQDALAAYSQAYLAPTLGDNSAVALKVADMYTQTNQPELALSIYQELYYKSDDDYLKAQADLLMGRIRIAQGDLEGGFNNYQDAVNNYPLAYDSYSALSALVEAEQPVDELQRGLINYYVGKYDLAVEAFDRYLASSDALKDKALYYKALTVRAAGLEKASLDSNERFNLNVQGGMESDKQAIVLWSQLISDYPASSYRVDAMEDIIYTQNTYMGQISLAIQTALAFVADAPDSSYAARLLWTAGRYYTLDNKPLEAADTWTQIGLEHPEADEAFEGLLFAGILYYQSGKLDQAANNFNRAVLISAEPFETAGAYLWLGKTSEKLGDAEASRRWWQIALETDPNGYYSIRAEELLNDQPVFQQPASINLNIDLSNERRSAAVWMRTTFNVPGEINLEYDQDLFNDPRMIRGMEYFKLGLYPEASAEFDSLRNDNASDPVNTFRLLKVFLDYGFYRSAILSAQSLTRLAGFENDLFSPNLPPYLAYINYGAYFQPWVEAASKTHALPELLLYSLIRQESHFEGHATSSAGANGLMQIMPETGAQIALEIGFPANYSQDDLRVPYYSLELGTTYLARQVQLFDGDLYAALAAYNGGPGNAINWKKTSGSDPDVLLGNITYQETRAYIRSIVENYAAYVKIYGH